MDRLCGAHWHCPERVITFGLIPKRNTSEYEPFSNAIPLASAIAIVVLLGIVDAVGEDVDAHMPLVLGCSIMLSTLVMLALRHTKAHFATRYGFIVFLDVA